MWLSNAWWRTGWQLPNLIALIAPFTEHRDMTTVLDYSSYLWNLIKRRVFHSGGRSEGWAHGHNVRYFLKQLGSLPSDDTNKNHLVAKHSTLFPWNVQNFFTEKGRKEITQKVLYFAYHLGDSFLFLWRVYDVTRGLQSACYFDDHHNAPPPSPHLNTLWYTLNRVIYL